MHETLAEQAWNFSRALIQNGLNILVLLAIKMCFAKQLFSLFLVNQEKLLVVLAKCFKNYLDFKLSLLLHFRFPRARIFQNTSFSHPFIVAGLGITSQLTRWEPVVLLILFTFLGCLRLLESSIKILCMFLG